MATERYLISKFFTMNAFGRLFRQLFVSSIFLILVFGSGYLVYKKISPTLPTCFDNIQNQGEEGIDCGMVCNKVCPLPPRPAEVERVDVEWAKAVISGVSTYDLVAKINNPNELWGLSNYNYQFIVEDQNGEVILTKNGSSYLMPDGYDYVIVSSEKIDSVPKKVEFKISDEIWAKLSEDYNISKTSWPINQPHYTLRDENGFPSASGILGNKTSYDFEQIDIKVAIFSLDNDLLGVNVTNMNTMHAGEERYFRMVWNMAPTKDIRDADFRASTNLFNSKNFMKRYGTDEKFNGYR